MSMLIAVAAGGAAGALLRYWVSHHLLIWSSAGFPWATFTVNAIGSLLIGIVYVLMIEKLDVSHEWRGAISVGILGALTTFSTFSLETLRLIESGEVSTAIVNVLANVLVCLAACALGLWVTRQLV